MDRPLTGEPRAVDLVNTRWHADGGVVDMLATATGLAQWLGEQGLGEQGLGEQGLGMPVGERADRRLRAALVHTRDALARAFAGDPDAEDDVNAVLARALVVRSIHDGHVHEHPVFADEAWRPAWLAADDYVRLREAAPDGIRQCGHPSCVLWFYDPGGRRRWCSMARCGNRAKAQRHYSRQRDAGTASAP